jgi:hypothetical protein
MMDSTEKEYSHPELNTQVTAIGGSYILVKEVQLLVDGENVLYLIGSAIFDTTCCGVGGCAYALVPGTIRQWKIKKDPEGRPVSMVSPILRPNMKEKIKKLIFKKEPVHQVNFL